MTSKRELEAEVSDLRWELKKAALAVAVEEEGAERYRKEVERLEKSLAQVKEDCTTAYHRQQVVEQENAELREEVEHYRKEAERLREEAADLVPRLYNAEKALKVLAPTLYRRYTPRIGLRAGEMDWDALIADAKRVEEYNATTEVLHFIEASQEGEPF